MSHIESNQEPVTQITFVECDPRKQAEALSLMRKRAQFMERQPGFVSISLHRSLDGRRIVNFIKWQSRELLESAHKAPEFRKEWDYFGRMTDEIEPSIYEVTSGLGEH